GQLPASSADRPSRSDPGDPGSYLPGRNFFRAPRRAPCVCSPKRCSCHTRPYAASAAFWGLLGCVPFGHAGLASNLYPKARTSHQHNHSTDIALSSLATLACLGLLATNLCDQG